MQVTAKNKIDAPMSYAKENRSTARWHMNDFLPHEMFKICFYDRKTHFTRRC